MRNKTAREERARFVPRASGKVLEVGIGSGLNLPYYAAGVERVVGIDPSLELWRMARRRVGHTPFPVEFVGRSAESIPAGDGTFDTVVVTWALCSIPDPLRALGEMRRVLKPGGRLIFVEHGRSPDERVAARQERLTPLWKRLGGGCHLNRRIDELILGAGFRIAEMERGYGQGVKALAFLYKGVALPV
jgi:ubiquinone/menaquinone biosynthesis C-methylase UbiE